MATPNEGVVSITYVNGVMMYGTFGPPTTEAQARKEAEAELERLKEGDNAKRSD